MVQKSPTRRPKEKTYVPFVFFASFVAFCVLSVHFALSGTAANRFVALFKEDRVLPELLLANGKLALDQYKERIKNSIDQETGDPFRVVPGFERSHGIEKSPEQANDTSLLTCYYNSTVEKDGQESHFIIIWYELRNNEWVCIRSLTVHDGVLLHK